MPISRTNSRAAASDRTEILTQLKEDHKRVQKAYRNFQKLDADKDPESCQALVEQVLDELTMHSTLEEQLLYPAARSAIADGSLLDEAEMEHESVRARIEQLRGMGPDDEKYAAHFAVLCEDVMHHVTEEEGELFPQLENARLDWESLATEMAQRREELMPSEGTPTPMSPPPVLLVFSHLRWGFVYQRPQHLLARLAERWRVLYVEEPIHTDGPAHLEMREVSSRLTVMVPYTPVSAAGFHDDQLGLLQPLLDTALRARSLHVDVAWLYTPMALPLAKSFAPTCLVYDCMDELSGFKDAPRQLRQRESALLKEAVQVFTGGPSLYEARRGLHPSVHCFPSAVDGAHFSPANLDPNSDHAKTADALQDALPRPRLGFFGVIDERLDLELVAAIADQHPEWAVVMAGPVVKIDPRTLPHRPNIHWLGMQPYERLPYLLAGWDVCLMPFALNEATRFISPTKTLEYMAGDKPVVSTPVRDVIFLYGAAVAVAPASRPFVQACEAVLAETATARCKRNIEMLNTVSMHSWQRTAESMDGLLQAALQQAHQQLTVAALAQPQRVAAVPGGGARDPDWQSRGYRGSHRAERP